MYTPILPPITTWEWILVLSFVVVVVGGMGSLRGSRSGFLARYFAVVGSMTEVKQIFPGIDQIIIYLIAMIVLLVRPRGLMGRKGVMED